MSFKTLCIFGTKKHIKFEIILQISRVESKAFQFVKEIDTVGDKFWIWRIFCSIKDLGVNRKLEQAFYKKNNKAIVQGSRFKNKV